MPVLKMMAVLTTYKSTRQVQRAARLFVMVILSPMELRVQHGPGLLKMIFAT